MSPRLSVSPSSVAGVPHSVRPVAGDGTGGTGSSSVLAPWDVEPWTEHPAVLRPDGATGTWREVYLSAGGGHDWSVRRIEGEAPTGDALVDAAFDGLGVADAFYRQVLGRRGIDDADGRLRLSIREGRPQNGLWNSAAGGIRLDGTGANHTALQLDTIAHEYTHGVFSAVVPASVPRGSAVDESFADVLGEIAQQWHDHPARLADPAAARAWSWNFGESADGVVRDLDHPEQSGDPATLADIARIGGDDPHSASTVPSHAAYLAATQIGSEAVAHVWYDAMRAHLREGTIEGAARATSRAAVERFGATSREAAAVESAWRAVGALAPAPTSSS